MSEFIEKHMPDAPKKEAETIITEGEAPAVEKSMGLGGALKKTLSTGADKAMSAMTATVAALTGSSESAEKPPSAEKAAVPPTIIHETSEVPPTIVPESSEGHKPSMLEKVAKNLEEKVKEFMHPEKKAAAAEHTEAAAAPPSAADVAKE